MVENHSRRTRRRAKTRRDADADGDADGEADGDALTTPPPTTIDASSSEKKTMRQPTLWDWLCTATAEDFESEDKMTELFTLGNVDDVSCALERGLVMDRRCTNAAARCNRIDCLEYLNWRGCELDAMA